MPVARRRWEDQWKPLAVSSVHVMRGQGLLWGCKREAERSVGGYVTFTHLTRSSGCFFFNVTGDKCWDLSSKLLWWMFSTCRVSVQLTAQRDCRGKRVKKGEAHPFLPRRFNNSNKTISRHVYLTVSSCSRLRSIYRIRLTWINPSIAIWVNKQTLGPGYKGSRSLWKMWF